MSVTFKLVGYQAELKNDFNHTFDSNGFSLKDIYLLFMNKGMLIHDLKKLKFIMNGEALSNLEKKYQVEINPKVVFIFTNDSKIKNALLEKIFINITKPVDTPLVSMVSKVETTTLEDKVEEDVEQTQEEINTINKQICQNFQDSDFKTLLRICLSKPELVKLMNNFLSSGNIVEEFGESNVTEFNYSNEYDELHKLLVLPEIGYQWNEAVVKSALNYFNGHLNLTLRYLLTYQNSIVEKS